MILFFKSPEFVASFDEINKLIGVDNEAYSTRTTYNGSTKSIYTSKEDVHIKDLVKACVDFTNENARWYNTSFRIKLGVMHVSYMANKLELIHGHVYYTYYSKPHFTFSHNPTMLVISADGCHVTDPVSNLFYGRNEKGQSIACRIHIDMLNRWDEIRPIIKDTIGIDIGDKNEVEPGNIQTMYKNTILNLIEYLFDARKDVELCGKVVELLNGCSKEEQEKYGLDYVLKEKQLLDELAKIAKEHIDHVTKGKM